MTRYFDVPVVFVVAGEDDDAAATALIRLLVAVEDALGTGQADPLDSWHLPNHPHLDGSDPGPRLTITFDDRVLTVGPHAVVCEECGHVWPHGCHLTEGLAHLDLGCPPCSPTPASDFDDGRGAHLPRVRRRPRHRGIPLLHRLSRGRRRW